MRFIVVAALATLATLATVTAYAHHSHAAPTEKQLESLFTSFIKTHNKQYAHSEFFPRFNVFKTNLEKIRQHNKSAAAAKRFTMAANEFTDLTWEEFKATRINGFKKVDYSVLREKNTVRLNNSIPASVDWRTSGAVTDVKDQGQCGSCWSFSTTGAVEGAVAKSTGNLVSLSEQELIDCSSGQGNEGCNGGLMDYGFEYIKSNGGLSTESNYPYAASGPNTCKPVGEKVSAISSYTDVPVGDEDQLAQAVALQPVSIAIEADQESFQFYSTGVLTSACGTAVDHGVLAVGYGTDAETGTPYWIVKNSWGATWGESGYIRLQKGINQCGLTQSASYPVV